MNWTRAPATHRYVSKTFENCNYLQALEGGLDTAHSSFAHYNKLGDRSNLRQHDRSPHIDVERTDYGYYYVSQRNVDDGKYVRVYHYVMPAQQLRASVIGYEGVRNNRRASMGISGRRSMMSPHSSTTSCARPIPRTS